MNNFPLHDDERIDDLHRDGLLLIQKTNGFRFGTDAVLLAAFAKAAQRDRVMDLCTGTGIIPVLMSARTRAADLYGIEIDPDTAEMASRTVLLNNLSSRVHIVCGDIRDIRWSFEASSFQTVTANPPYLKSGEPSGRGTIAAARHEILCSIEEVAAAAAWLLTFGGAFYLVHRPDRLMDVLTALRQAKLEPKCLRFVHSYIGRPPALALIKAVYGGRPNMTVMPPFVIHEPCGAYTDEARGVYYGES